MEFISYSRKLTKLFDELCAKYSHYQWAVAWAGDPRSFKLAKVLLQNEYKIDKLIVGLHFYQTSPKFIEEFIDNDDVRYVMQPDGTYHPKVYLFYNTQRDWAAIIGSANFTDSGFNRNTEASIYVDSNDQSVSFREISSFISNLWRKGKNFDLALLRDYENTCNLQKSKIQSLKKTVGLQSNKKPASPLDVITWDEYVSRILKEDADGYWYRMQLLKKARTIFEKGIAFNKLPDNVKLALGGVNSQMDAETDIDWQWFGSMKGSGYYRQALISDDKIGKAIDKIPLDGPVTKKDFEEYCKAFSAWKNPLASATRLLAIKRPDKFVCIDSKNKKGLSKMLNIPQSQITLDNYWDEILHNRIWESIWYNEKVNHASGVEREIRKYKVAMLDSLSYVR